MAKRKREKASEPGTAVARVGRPSFEFSEEDIRRIENLAAVLTQAQIGAVFGMDARTFRRHCRKDSRIMSAYEKGRAQAVALVGENLILKALRGDVTAAIFYLKTQGGWREKVVVRNFDPTRLTDEQLERIASGEDIELVLSDGADR